MALVHKELPLSNIIPGKDLILDEGQVLHVIEWKHMHLHKFFPMTLGSSLVVRSLIYPMDLVRARLQLQEQNNVYRNMRQAFMNIVRTEGFFALYKGFLISTPQIGAMFIYSTVYERVRDLLKNKAGITNPSIVSSMSGGTATASDQLASVPMDIIAQHMMVINKSQSFSGSSHGSAIGEFVKNDKREGKMPLGLRVIRAVYKIDGIYGFYRGICASMLLYIPSCMVFWASYYQCLGIAKKLRYFYCMKKRRDKPKNCSEKNLLLMQSISGGVAGMFSAICTNPLEMLRIRVQIHRTGYVNTIKRMISVEGYRIFYKGLPPRIISLGTYSFLTMLIYETIKRFCIKPEYKKLIIW